MNRKRVRRFFYRNTLSTDNIASWCLQEIDDALVLLPCCAFICLYTYPAVPLFFFALTLLCPLSSFTITTYPAVTLFFFALTLPRQYYTSHLHCYALNFLYA